MNVLRFEEKGTWVELDIKGMKYEWDSNQNDYRKWPDTVSTGYANALIEISKKIEDQEKKIEYFFHAKGVVTKGRLFKELFRNITWPYSKEELDYIKETKKQAEDFFTTGIVSF